MRISIGGLHGSTLAGTDEEFGTVHDLFFDERSWKVQFLVVDTRKWLVGDFVLVGPLSLGRLDPKRKILATSLTKRQVQESPNIEAHLPVSRQHAHAAAKYWDWPYFLPGDPRFDVGAFDDDTSEAPDSSDPGPEESLREDPHLRSARDTRGYHVRVFDGEEGHVEEWLVDTDTWTLREAVIDTRNWLPGEKLLLPCEKVTQIIEADEVICVGLTREQLSHLPRYTGTDAGDKT